MVFDLLTKYQQSIVTLLTHYLNIFKQKKYSSIFIYSFNYTFKTDQYKIQPMKPLFFLLLFLVTLFAFNASSIRDITDKDLRLSLATHPELYDYSNFEFTHKVQTRYKNQNEMTFSYRFKRVATTHIAIIDGEETAVDNDFVNDCIDHQSRYECRFITEMGTIEYPHSNTGHYVLEKWGIFSRSNIKKKALDKETSHTLSHFTDLF